jgi:parvulin-like peptidyl-prolyl isomerase
VRLTSATVERWALMMRDDDAGDSPVTAGQRRTGLRILLWLNMTVEEARRQHLPLRYDAVDGMSPEEIREVMSDTLPKPATRADRRLWVDGLLASTALTRAAVARLPPPSDAALERLWSRQREPAWFTPRQVRAEVVELPSAAKAREALAALQAGEGFAAVGARLSGRAATGYHGEAHLFAGPVEDERAQAKLLRAVLTAKPAELVGPLADDGGWFVARVVEVVSERARIPLAQVRSRLTELVRFERSQAVEERFARQLVARWSKRTTCVRPFVIRRLCGRVVARPLR